MEQLRIGMVGTGLVGATHSIMLRQIATARPGRVELTAVADPDAAIRHRFIEQYGYPRSFGCGEELLENGGVNGGAAYADVRRTTDR